MKTVKMFFVVVAFFVGMNAHANVAQDFIQDAGQGNIEKVRSYLHSSWNVNVKNKYGVTALMLATMNGRLDVVKLLVKEGANVNARNKNGQTALIFAVHAFSIDSVKVLIRGGVNVHMKDVSGDSAYTLAVRYDNMKMVRLLRKASKGSQRSRMFRSTNRMNNASFNRAVRNAKR